MTEPIRRRTFDELTDKDYEYLEQHKPLPKDKYNVNLMLTSMIADTYPLEHPYVRGLYARIEGMKAEYKSLFGIEWVNPLGLEEDYRRGDSSH